MLSPGIKEYQPEKNFNQVRNLGITPLEAVTRTLDLIGAPMIGKGQPNQPLAKPVYEGTLPPTPENPSIRLRIRSRTTTRTRSGSIRTIPITC